ncbi:replication initiation protein [Pseudomonas oryzihabitans]|uniref:replication initiation protein n=1 Tax=Pseudomonas oryzihabitans TaxID=47885 RepID=UPI0011A57937|nr:replication initiation protein [Pseudomonas oryzihabitans]
MSRTSCYNELKKAALRLGDRKAILPHGMTSDAETDENTRVTWVSAVSYSKRGALVRLRFAAEFMPYISQLNEKFAHYKVTDIMALSTCTAMDLFEILIQWRTIQFVQVPLEQLRFMLALTDKYPEYNVLRKRVIEPTIAKINQRMPIEVEWILVKNGSTIVALDFRYKFKGANPELLDEIPFDQTSKQPAARKAPQKCPRKTKGDPEWLTREYIQQALIRRTTVADAETRIRDEHGLPETPQSTLL